MNDEFPIEPKLAVVVVRYETFFKMLSYSYIIELKLKHSMAHSQSILCSCSL